VHENLIQKFMLGALHGMHAETKSFKPTRITGVITAHPNPIPLTTLSGFVSTTLQWICRGTDAVEVRVGAPDGTLLSRSGQWGRAETGQWVSNGMTFYLQDVSRGKPLTHENTISAVTVRTGLEPLAVCPDILPFAAHAGQGLDCTHIISIGCHTTKKQVVQLYPQFEIIWIDLNPTT
jgi:hypothetical protein